jgi:hypothetical protein
MKIKFLLLRFLLAASFQAADAADRSEFYPPYKGQQSEKDLVKFYKGLRILFQKEVNKQHLCK